jgi:hypothetical protein
MSPFSAAALRWAFFVHTVQNNFSMGWKRDFFKRNEGQLTVLQLIGFMLLIFGVMGMIIPLIFDGLQTLGWIPAQATTQTIMPSVIPIAFFITMLGVAFAYPSLLEGNEGLSTMRITVFMVTNVICMLLLKIGWLPGTTSLDDIKLDWYWMGVIAFVFGAKATQAFFESKFAPERKEKPRQGSNAEAALRAKEQHASALYAKHPNILEVSDAVDTDGSGAYVLALYLSDNATSGIPDSVEVNMADGSRRTIDTQILPDVGKGSIHVNQTDKISNDSSDGSVGCVVASANGDKYAVTSGHVYSKGRLFDYGGELDTADQTAAQVGSINGNWFFQIIDEENDIALAAFTPPATPDPNLITFNGHYPVADADIGKTKVKVVSNISGQRDAYIIDHNTSWDVPYNKKAQHEMKNVILIGDNKDRTKCKSVSQKGDSGGCVYEEKSKQLVGIILGGNNSFTWILPIKKVLDDHNFKLS